MYNMGMFGIGRIGDIALQLSISLTQVHWGSRVLRSLRLALSEDEELSLAEVAQTLLLLTGVYLYFLFSKNAAFS